DEALRETRGYRCGRVVPVLLRIGLRHRRRYRDRQRDVDPLKSGELYADWNHRRWTNWWNTGATPRQTRTSGFYRELERTGEPDRTRCRDRRKGRFCDRCGPRPRHRYSLDPAKGRP